MADETLSKPTTATLAPGSERPDYRGKCLYKTGKCLNERALKTSGAAHNLCDEHRSRQNEHQRKLDAKNRVTKKERRNSTGKLPTAAAVPRERTPRFAPYPMTGGANPAVSKRRSLPAASAAVADTSDDTDSAGGLETGMSIASAAAAATAAAIANLAPATSPPNPGLLGLASSASAAHTPVVATSSGGVVYLPNGPQPPQLSYPFVMQDFDGIVVPLPSYLEGQERVEFRSRIYQKVLDFISEECILRFGAKTESAAAVAVPVAAEALATTEAAPEPEPQMADAPTEPNSSRRQDNSVLDAKQITPAEPRAVHSSKKPNSHSRAAAGRTSNI